MRYFKTGFFAGPEKFRFPGFLFAPGGVRRCRIRPFTGVQKKDAAVTIGGHGFSESDVRES